MANKVKNRAPPAVDRQEKLRGLGLGKSQFTATRMPCPIPWEIDREIQETV